MNTESSAERRSATELLLAYFDDDLDEAGLAELNEGLESDPVFQHEAAEFMIQERHLYIVAAEMARSVPLATRLSWTVEILKEWVAEFWNDRLPRPLRWAFPCGLAAVVLLLVSLQFRAVMSMPKCTALQGAATVERAGSARPVFTGLRLKAGDLLRLATNSSVELAFSGEATSLRFWGAAQVIVRANSGSKQFVLQRGGLCAVVARQAPSAPLRISTPHGQATVLGTDFTLDVDATRTRLEVWEGTVRLRDRLERASLDVAAGQFGVADDLEPLQSGPIRQGVTRECWLDEANPGDRPLNDLPCLARSPALRAIMAEFAGPPNWNDSYVSRLRAFLRPRVSGLYQFWISGDDRAELWLSSDEQPEHKTRICASPQWCGPEEWDKNPAQQSAPVRLEAGRKYYIEALHYEAAGGDSVAVAWLPPGSLRQIIPVGYVLPYPDGEIEPAVNAKAGAAGF